MIFRQPYEECKKVIEKDSMIFYLTVKTNISDQLEDTINMINNDEVIYSHIFREIE